VLLMLLMLLDVAGRVGREKRVWLSLRVGRAEAAAAVAGSARAPESGEGC